MKPYYYIRDPWWRFKHYLRLWGITMIVATGVGWVTGGWDGIIFSCLTASALQAILFPIWEYGERRKDKEYRDWPDGEVRRVGPPTG